jgi:hypothetical protein
VSEVVLEGVPSSISHEDFLGLVRSIGLDPKNLRSLEFRNPGIYAEVFARNSEGHLIVGDDNEIVTHKVFIPVVYD